MLPQYCSLSRFCQWCCNTATPSCRPMVLKYCSLTPLDQYDCKMALYLLPTNGAAILLSPSARPMVLQYCFISLTGMWGYNIAPPHRLAHGVPILFLPPQDQWYCNIAPSNQPCNGTAMLLQPSILPMVLQCCSLSPSG